MLKKLLSNLFASRSSLSVRRRQVRKGGKRCGFRPSVEGLEDRWLLSATWAHSAGGPGNDVGEAIATDKAGNVYVVGRFEQPTATFGGTTLTSAGKYDAFVAKYQADGTFLWAKAI